MKNKRADEAVSEIIGTVLLLALSIALFSSLQLMVFSMPFEPSAPSARLVASIDRDVDDEVIIIITHHGGESLSLADTKISLMIDGVQKPQFTPVIDPITSNDDDQCNIGERVIYLTGSTENTQADIAVIYIISNSVVMMGAVQEGS